MSSGAIDLPTARELVPIRHLDALCARGGGLSLPHRGDRLRADCTAHDRGRCGGYAALQLAAVEHFEQKLLPAEEGPAIRRPSVGGAMVPLVH